MFDKSNRIVHDPSNSTFAENPSSRFTPISGTTATTLLCRIFAFCVMSGRQHFSKETPTMAGPQIKTVRAFTERQIEALPKAAIRWLEECSSEHILNNSTFNKTNVRFESYEVQEVANGRANYLKGRIWHGLIQGEIEHVETAAIVAPTN